MDADPEHILARVAVAIGFSEFERRSGPPNVQPRHFETARDVLEELAGALHTQGFGARVNVLNTTSDLLTEAAHAPGPDGRGST
jgi:hypothetical protein